MVEPILAPAQGSNKSADEPSEIPLEEAIVPPLVDIFGQPERHLLGVPQAVSVVGRSVQSMLSGSRWDNTCHSDNRLNNEKGTNKAWLQQAPTALFQWHTGSPSFDRLAGFGAAHQAIKQGRPRTAKTSSANMLPREVPEGHSKRGSTRPPFVECRPARKHMGALEETSEQDNRNAPGYLGGPNDGNESHLVATGQQPDSS